MSSLSRSDSMSSAGSEASGASSQYSEGYKDGVLDENEAFEKSQNSWTAIFGVLYHLQIKDKLARSKRYVAARILVDFVTLFLLLLQQGWGWDIDYKLWLWKWSNWLLLKNALIPKGYTFYINIMYVLVSAVMCCVASFIWISFRCVRGTTIPDKWYMRLLRFMTTFIFQIFYITFLNFFSSNISCQLFCTYPGAVHGHLRDFPTVDCLKTPHLIHACVSIVMCLVLMGVGGAICLADFTVNPLCKNWLSMASPYTELKYFVFKTIMVLAINLLWGVFGGKLQTLVLAFLGVWTVWVFIRWEPHYFPWFNHLRAGLYACYAWTSILLAALVWHTDHHEPRYQKKITTGMWIGLAPVALACGLASYLRLRRLTNAVLKVFKGADPSNPKLRSVYRFPNDKEVEIVARVCRKWVDFDDDEMDEQASKVADTILKAGQARFPSSAFLVVLYSNFLVEVYNNYTAGYSQLQLARKLQTGFMERFSMYVREQQHNQRMIGQGGASDNIMDLMGYVEQQRSFKNLIRTHKAALHAIRNFWKSLLHSQVTFRTLIDALAKIEKAKERTEVMYKSMLERYPADIRVLRSYGQFLEDIKNDPWSASQCYSEADKLELTEEQEAAVGDATGGGTMQEKNNLVCVINASGTIQMVNKPLLKVFGYKKAEVEGKNVSMLMPNPFSQRHNSYLRNYVMTGNAKILDTERLVVGVHKDRHVLPLDLKVTKVSGTGPDSVFMGVMKPYQGSGGVDNVGRTRMTAWLMPGGLVLSVDQNFIDCLGRTAEECNGRYFTSFGVEQEKIEGLLKRANEASEEDFTKGMLVLRKTPLLHKYTDPVDVHLRIDFAGTTDQRLFVVTATRLSTDGDMMMVVKKDGSILYATTHLAHLLEYPPKVLMRMSLGDLMSQPFSQLHARWMKGMPLKPPTRSCRGGAPVMMLNSKGATMPVKLAITTREVDEKVHHIVQVKPVEICEALKDRRATFTIDRQGKVISVENAPKTLFGFSVSLLQGRTLAEFIDVFHFLEPTGASNGVDLEHVIQAMIARALEVKEMSWRVGIHPPTSSADLQETKKNTLRQNVLNHQTKAAVLQLDIAMSNEDASSDEDEDGGGSYAYTHDTLAVHIWNAEIMTAVVDVDRNNIITRAGCCALHMPGILFGCASSSMLKQPLHKYLKVPHNPELLIKEKVKKGLLKNQLSSGIVQVGPLRHYTGKHFDGGELEVQLQACTKEGEFNKIIVKMTVENQKTGNPTMVKQLLAGAHLTHMDSEKTAKTGAEGGGNSDDDRSHDDSDGGTKYARSLSSSETRDPEGDLMMAPAPVEGNSDGQSQGGGEEEAASEVDNAEEHLQADFRRGKRLRKLLKMLRGKQVQVAQKRFSSQALVATVVLLVVHLVCFLVSISMIRNQRLYANEVDKAGNAVTSMHIIMICSRVVDTVYKNISHPLVVTPVHLPFFLKLLKSHLTTFESSHQATYLGQKNLRRLNNLKEYRLQQCWEGPTWDAVELLDVGSPELVVSKEGLWEMGNQVISDAWDISHNHAAMATKGNISDTRQFVSLLSNIYGGLYDGYMYSLDGMVERAGLQIKKVNKMMLAFLMVEGCVVFGLVAYYMYTLALRFLTQRRKMFVMFLFIPTGFLRALASKQITLDADDDADTDSESGDAAPAQQQATSGGTTKMTVTLNKGAKKGMLGGPIRHVELTAMQRIWMVVRKVLRLLAGQHSAGGDQRLATDMRDVLVLVAPFILWAVGIIALYAITYRKLSHLREPFLGLNSFNFIVFRCMRVIQMALEMCLETDPTLKAEWRSRLAYALEGLTREYLVFLYGATPEDTSYHMQGVGSNLFLSRHLAYLWFKKKGCLRHDASTCLKDDHPYYDVTNNGIDPMLQRYLHDGQLLVQDPDSKVNLDSTRLHFMWNVGQADLFDGLSAAYEVTRGETEKLYDGVIQAHVLVLVFSILGAMLYWWGVIQPFLQAAYKESYQVAELLSHMPNEMDVEGMVREALENGGDDLDPSAAAGAGGKRRMSDLGAKGPPGSPKGGQGYKGEVPSDNFSDAASEMSSIM